MEVTAPRIDRVCNGTPLDLAAARPNGVVPSGGADIDASEDQRLARTTFADANGVPQHVAITVLLSGELISAA